MKKILIICMILSLSGCIFIPKEKDPRLDHPAFDIIGDQGLNPDISLEDLHGEYVDCKLWLEPYEGSSPSNEKIECVSVIQENILFMEWEKDKQKFTLDNGIIFTFDKGLIYTDFSDNPEFIAMIKRYPSGHMVDGLILVKSGEETIKIHFQMIKSSPS